MLDNKREYFRIRDRLSLEIAELNDEPPKVSADEYFDDNEFNNLQRQINQAEHEFSPLLSGIASKNRDVASALRLLNRKLELMSQAMNCLAEHDSAKQKRDVSISEGGIAFGSKKPYALDQSLAMRLTLYPQQSSLCVFATVVECIELNGLYRVSAEFFDLRESERQIIAKHIINLQLEAKRQARHSPH